MKHYPRFFRHPSSGEDCLLVLAATGPEEMPARLAALASTWRLIGVSCGDEFVFTYKFQGRLWAASIAAKTGGDAEAQLNALAEAVWSRGVV